MKRIQAFEFNELPATPRFIRESIVEILGNGLSWGRVFSPVAPVFMEFCQKARADRVVDLCSGSGRPVSILLDAIKAQGMVPPQFVLTDLLPNPAAMEKTRARHPDSVRIIEKPVDATRVPADVDQPARTIINAFHHFNPELAFSILADTVARRRAVFIVEGFKRERGRFLPLMPALTASYLLSPFLAEKDRKKKIFFSYFLPLVSLCGGWDAVISFFRTRTEAELFEMAGRLHADYRWEYREAPYFPGGVNVVFFGIPTESSR